MKYGTLFGLILLIIIIVVVSHTMSIRFRLEQFETEGGVEGFWTRNLNVASTNQRVIDAINAQNNATTAAATAAAAKATSDAAAAAAAAKVKAEAEAAAAAARAREAEVAASVTRLREAEAKAKADAEAKAKADAEAKAKAAEMPNAIAAAASAQKGVSLTFSPATGTKLPTLFGSGINSNVIAVKAHNNSVPTQGTVMIAEKIKPAQQTDYDKIMSNINLRDKVRKLIESSVIVTTMPYATLTQIDDKMVDAICVSGLKYNNNNPTIFLTVINSEFFRTLSTYPTQTQLKIIGSLKSVGVVFTNEPHITSLPEMLRQFSDGRLQTPAKGDYSSQTTEMNKFLEANNMTYPNLIVIGEKLSTMCENKPQNIPMTITEFNNYITDKGIQSLYKNTIFWRANASSFNAFLDESTRINPNFWKGCDPDIATILILARQSMLSIYSNTFKQTTNTSFGLSANALKGNKKSSVQGFETKDKEPSFSDYVNSFFGRIASLFGVKEGLPIGGKDISEKEIWDMFGIETAPKAEAFANKVKSFVHNSRLTKSNKDYDNAIYFMYTLAQAGITTHNFEIFNKLIVDFGVKTAKEYIKVLNSFNTLKIQSLDQAEKFLKAVLSIGVQMSTYDDFISSIEKFGFVELNGELRSFYRFINDMNMIGLSYSDSAEKINTILNYYADLYYKFQTYARTTPNDVSPSAHIRGLYTLSDSSLNAQSPIEKYSNNLNDIFDYKTSQLLVWNNDPILTINGNKYPPRGFGLTQDAISVNTAFIQLITKQGKSRINITDILSFFTIAEVKAIVDRKPIDKATIFAIIQDIQKAILAYAGGLSDTNQTQLENKIKFFNSAVCLNILPYAMFQHLANTIAGSPNPLDPVNPNNDATRTGYRTNKPLG